MAGTVTRLHCAQGSECEVGVMVYSIHSVAKTFAELSDWTLSNLELNKLCYLAHMIKLGRTEGREGLVRNVFEAWDYGPVSPALYHKAKSFGSGDVGNVFHQHPSVTSGIDKEAIEEVWQAVGSRSPGQLVAITHWEQGAWYKNYQAGVKGIVISDEDILDEFRKRTAPQAA